MGFGFKRLCLFKLKLSHAIFSTEKSRKSTYKVTESGYQMYHNYLRPHMGLNGMTPAQACGIDIQGDNKWLTLIQNASRREA
jgi:hypothetical protein